MDIKSTGCLCTLAAFSGLVCLVVQGCDDRERISRRSKGLPATLIKSTTENDKTYYFIDTDKNLKTAEYALFTEVGTSDDIQLKAEILNHTAPSPFQMPLEKWRQYSQLFERIHD